MNRNLVIAKFTNPFGQDSQIFLFILAALVQGKPAQELGNQHYQLDINRSASQTMLKPITLLTL